ncbi:hypothetical protein [Arenibacter palladensis]|uniref:hypothetical protein n=1 Tax=Arenibacter palladensis TaxID=237373 RepID=UPI0026E30D1D|nr:hypothetical protein [Arenibacter palladensis]MDO6605294.1 hypothetical protein [Arenibacter palladensis]
MKRPQENPVAQFSNFTYLQMSLQIIDKEKLVSAFDVAEILQVSRGQVDRLQLKGLLRPVPTIYPKYYYKRDEVLNLKKVLTHKSNKS